uniref:Uncharacterized protein n=1 Tax=Rhizophora mucronata TaxID=61149 RepID=A0A2P2NCT9_RHIMU
MSIIKDYMLPFMVSFLCFGALMLSTREVNIKFCDCCSGSIGFCFSIHSFILCPWIICITMVDL